MKIGRLENFILSFTIFVFFFFVVSLTYANVGSDNSKVAFRKMNVPGEVYGEEVEEENTPDEESIMLDKELKNNRKSLKQFVQKEGKYNKLKDVVEKMTERHQDYMEAKVDYEKIVGDYNKKIECINNPNQADCKEFLKNWRSKDKNQAVIKDLSSEGPQYQEAVLSILSGNAVAFKRCYQGQLDQGKLFEGDVELFIIISSEGKVAKGDITRVVAVGSNKKINGNSQLMTDCLLQTVYSLKFPATPNGTMVKVVQPIKLSGRRS